MSAVEDKIKAMGHTLPAPFKFPNPNRTGCVVVGSVVFVSGHGRNLGGADVKGQGKVGRDLTLEEGYATARAVALSMLASLKAELGDLDRIKRVVRLFGMVNVAPGFDRMPQVIDGASDFFLRAVRPEGRPARAHRSRNGRTAARYSGRDQWRVRALLIRRSLAFQVDESGKDPDVQESGISNNRLRRESGAIRARRKCRK